MTDVEDLRSRLQVILDRSVAPGEVECPVCHGTGRVVRNHRTVTQTDVATAIGTTRTGVSTFLAGRQTFGMAVTLRLLDWLAAQEADQ